MNDLDNDFIVPAVTTSTARGQGLDELQNQRTTIANSEAQFHGRPPPIEETFCYTTLEELPRDAIRASVNVFAVIAGFQRPLKLRNGSHKYSMTYNLIDNTRPFPSSAIVLNVFSDDIDKLIIPYQVGDIIRCHRLKLKPYRNEPQLIGATNYASFILISRRREALTGLPLLNSSTPEDELDDEEQHLPGDRRNIRSSAHVHLPSTHWNVRSSTGRFSSDPDGALRVKQLNTWSETFFMETLLTDIKEQSMNLFELEQLTTVDVVRTTSNTSSNGFQPLITPRSTCDIIVLLLDVSSISNTLTVWDGTTPSVFSTLSVPDLPLETVLAIQRSVHAACIFSDILDPASLYSSAARSRLYIREESSIVLLGGARKFMVHESVMPALRETLRPGMWIKMRDVFCMSPIIERPVEIPVDIVGKVNEATYAVPLQPYFRDVISIAQAYLSRVRRHMDVSALQLPTANRIVERRSVSSSGVPYLALATCLAKPSPAKLCCLANVLSWNPPDIQSFVYTDQESASRKYLFSLRIGDDTAQFDAIFTGEDAQFFLGGVLPQHFDEVTQRKVAERLQEIVAGRLTLEFFLRSYTVPLNGNESLGSSINAKRFRVYNTSLFAKKLS